MARCAHTRISTDKLARRCALKSPLHQNRRIRMKIVKALTVVVLLVSAPAFAASDIFAKIGNIRGESKDSSHRDWIEISSFSWGMNAAVPAQRACATNEIRFALVKLTPELIQKCQTNERLPEVVIDLHGERHVLQ